MVTLVSVVLTVAGGLGAALSWALSCQMPGHRAAGMEGTLVVSS
jgi:uncharacterized cupredoxin-like copper-binding protein